MANTVAKAWGDDGSGRVKETSRMGSVRAEVEAATWKTKVNAYVNADGSGSVVVIRNREVVHRYDFGPEE